MGNHEKVSKGLPAQLEAEWQSSLVGKEKLTPDDKAPHSRCNVWLYTSPERFVHTTWLPPSTPLYSGVSDFHRTVHCVCEATGTKSTRGFHVRPTHPKTEPET